MNLIQTLEITFPYASVLHLAAITPDAKIACDTGNNLTDCLKQRLIGSSSRHCLSRVDLPGFIGKHY